MISVRAAINRLLDLAGSFVLTLTEIGDSRLPFEDRVAMTVNDERTKNATLHHVRTGISKSKWRCNRSAWNHWWQKSRRPTGTNCRISMMSMISCDTRIPSSKSLRPRHHDHESVGNDRRRSVMHLLIILILLCLVFPAFGRLLGGCLSVVLWLIAAVVVRGVLKHSRTEFSTVVGSLVEHKYSQDSV